MQDKSIEIIKELGRWAFLFALSWLITETLNQIVNVPEFYQLKVWVFTYMIPVRALLQVSLTGFGRLVDRLVHDRPEIPLKGIIPW